MLIKIVLPQAAQLGINFLIGKSVMLRLLEGPVYGLITENRNRKKAKHPAGIRPMTSLLQGVGSTTVIQLLPNKYWLDYLIGERDKPKCAPTALITPKLRETYFGKKVVQKLYKIIRTEDLR